MASGEIVPVSASNGAHYSSDLKTRCRLMAVGKIEGKRSWPTVLYATEHATTGLIDTGYSRFSSWEGVMSGEQGTPVRREVNLGYALLTRRGWDSQSVTSVSRVLQAKEDYSVRRPLYPSGGSTPNSSGGWAMRLVEHAGVIHEDSLVLSLQGADGSWLLDLSSSKWAIVYIFCGFENVETLDVDQWMSMAMLGVPATEPHAQRAVLGATLPIVRKRRESPWRIRIEPDPWL